MKEIGGYMELDRYVLPMLHESAIALNCARNALWYLCKAKNIKKLAIPKFLCDSVQKTCLRGEVIHRYYSIGKNLLPEHIELDEDEWLYIVNYYGQLNNEAIVRMKSEYQRIIVDNVQAYFQQLISGIDTIYTCRKFFGVPDGAFLYTDKYLEEELPVDESYDKIHYLFGRFERTAAEFYTEYTLHEKQFESEPIKKMSKLTANLLHGINYEAVRRRRTENFRILHSAFEKINQLKLTVPEGAFMYPLYIKGGAKIRKELQKEKIYIPTLWPNVFDICEEDELEYDMTANILPLPVDQRYGGEEMRYVIGKIMEIL